MPDFYAIILDWDRASNADALRLAASDKSLANLRKVTSYDPSRMSSISRSMFSIVDLAPPPTAIVNTYTHHPEPCHICALTHI